MPSQSLKLCNSCNAMMLAEGITKLQLELHAASVHLKDYQNKRMEGCEMYRLQLAAAYGASASCSWLRSADRCTAGSHHDPKPGAQSLDSRTWKLFVVRQLHVEAAP